MAQDQPSRNTGPMKLTPFLVLAVLGTPAWAQTHEPVAGALSGRSPHVMMRPIARVAVACDAVRASVPAGKSHAAHYPDPSCNPAHIAARDSDERLAVGR
jgi:hypothetical protein